MNKVVNIDKTNIKNDVTYYNICIKIPLRLIVVERRYSEFEELVQKLSKYLGIRQKDFPYKLPPKVSWFQNNSEAVINRRKVELSRFLDSVVKDQAIQNIDILHKFLELPNNFKFKPALFKEAGTQNIDVNIDEENIDSRNWTEVLNILRVNIGDLKEAFSSDSSTKSKINIKDEIHKSIQPGLLKLENSLKKSSLEVLSDEQLRRKSKLQKLKEDVTHLESTIDQFQDRKNLEPLKLSDSLKRFSKREIGSNATETSATVGVNNQNLLSNQIQIHKQQDEELELLRKVIARQREIGELINNEVEEQNELLDSFNQEVDSASDKINSARRRARKII